MKLGNRIKSGIALLGLLAPLVAAAPASATPQAPLTEYVIATENGQHDNVLDTVRNSGGIVLHESADSGLVLARLTSGLAETLDNFSGVTVGRNRTYSINGSTYKPANPSLDRIDQRTYPGDDRYSFSDKQLGAGVNIYIIDSGVQANHSQFTGRVQAGASFVNTVAANGDGPGNTDCDGHGTHVAGIAAGSTTGVAPKATIIPVQIFGCASDAPAETYRVVSALDWVIDHHKSGTPAVVNMSIGGSNDPVLIETIDEAVADGITVVVAAGNDTKDACNFSPANAPSAITVGAMSSGKGYDSISYFSNYGTCLDIFAPGGDYDPATHQTVTPILSANATVLAATSSNRNGDLAEMVGTSQAAPFVAGAAARYLSHNPHASAEEVTQVLLSTSTPDVFADSKGSPNRLLYIDPAGYKKATTDAPATPVGVSATYVADASVVVSWKSATATPTPTPTVKPSPSGTPAPVKSITCYKNTLTKVVKGTNPKCGTGWTTSKPKSISCSKGKLIKVIKGTNPKCPTGWKVKKPTPAVSPTPVPTVSASTVVETVTPTTNPVVDTVEDSAVEAAATPTAAVTGYTITATSRGGKTVTALADAKATTLRIEGLESGRTYRFTVTANSESGASSKSVPTNPVHVGTPVAQPKKDLPGAPTGLTVTPTTNGANLSWSDPTTDGGSPILMYLVEVSPKVGVVDFAVQETIKKVNSFFFNGLNSGIEYTFTVRALTAAGTSPASEPQKVTPSGQYIELPQGPNVRVKYNQGVLRVQWAVGTVSKSTRYVSGWEVTLLDAKTNLPVDRLDVKAGLQTSVDFGSAKMGQSYKIAITAVSRPLIGHTFTTDAFTMSKTLAEGSISQFDPNTTTPIYVPGMGLTLRNLKVSSEVTVEWAIPANQNVTKVYLSWQEFGKTTSPWSPRIGVNGDVTKHVIKDMPKGDWMLRIENVTDDGVGVMMVKITKTE